MFGAQQMAWAAERADLLAGADQAGPERSQMWNRVNRFEGWNHFRTEQRAFADWLAAQKVDGVVFLSATVTSPSY